MNINKCRKKCSLFVHDTLLTNWTLLESVTKELFGMDTIKIILNLTNLNIFQVKKFNLILTI